tara:strand:- start:844 stop:1188 length:345 start_codon:yes stop_codon:yes gene_type:complete
MSIHYLYHIKETQKNNSHIKNIFFNKHELNSILSFYGNKVSQGILKDYAIDCLSTQAIFSFYRNTFENAYIKIIKHNYISKSSIGYQLVNATGSHLKLSNDLDKIIKYLDNKIR